MEGARELGRCLWVRLSSVNCKCGSHRGKRVVESIPDRIVFLRYSGAIGVSGLVIVEGASELGRRLWARLSTVNLQMWFTSR